MLFQPVATRRPAAPSRRSALLALLVAVALGTGLLLGFLDNLLGRIAIVSALAGMALLAAAVVGWRRLPDDAALQRVGKPVAVVVIATALGLGLGAVGGLGGPVAMLLLPAALVAGCAVLWRPVIALALVVAVIPLGMIEVPGTGLGLKVIQVVALGGLSAAVVSRLVQGQLPLLVPKQLSWAVLIGAWGVVALLGAVDQNIALRQLVQLLVNVALALLAATVVRSLDTVRRLLWLLLAVASLSSLPALSGASDLSSSYGGAVVTGRLQGTFAQPNEFGSFMMTVAVLGTGLAFAARTGRERLLVLFGLVPVVLGLLLSLSRGSWIGLVAGAVVLLVLLPSARRILVVVGVPLVLTALALGAFAPESPQVQVVGDRVATFTAPGGGNPYDDRPRIWAEGRREVALAPVTGQGPGNFPVVSTQSTSGAQTVQAEHAHSVLLTVAAEYGLPAAGLLVGLTISCGFLVLAGVRRAARSDEPLVAGLGAAACAVAAQGVIDYTMRNAVLFTFFWLVAGLLVAAGRSAAGAPPDPVAAPEVTQRPPNEADPVLDRRALA